MADTIINVCPECGSNDLRVTCSVTADYYISDDGDGGQDWSRDKVWDETTEPQYVECLLCNALWDTVLMNTLGYITGLTNRE